MAKDDTAALLGAAHPSWWGGFRPQRQGEDNLLTRFYERPVEDPGYLQLWCYTDRLSYRPGEEVAIHACTTAERFSIAGRRRSRP